MDIVSDIQLMFIRNYDLAVSTMWPPFAQSQQTCAPQDVQLGISVPTAGRSLIEAIFACNPGNPFPLAHPANLRHNNYLSYSRRVGLGRLSRYLLSEEQEKRKTERKQVQC
jgi:hypothetical protein